MQAKYIKKHVPLVKRMKIAKRKEFFYDLYAILLFAAGLACMLWFSLPNA